jgi:hypothetical protein
MSVWSVVLACIMLVGLVSCSNPDPVPTGADDVKLSGEPPIDVGDTDGRIHPLAPRVGQENRYVMAFGIRSRDGLTWSYRTDTLVQRVVDVDGLATIIEERLAPGSALLAQLFKWGTDSVARYRLELFGDTLRSTVLHGASYFGMFFTPLMPELKISLRAVDSVPMYLNGMIPVGSATTRYPAPFLRHEQLGRTYENLVVNTAGDGIADGPISFVFASKHDGVVRTAEGGGLGGRWVVWDLL